MSTSSIGYSNSGSRAAQGLVQVIVPEPAYNPVPEPVEATERTLRTSSYIVYVDLPGEKERMLLVHGFTGAYDKVSKRVAMYLRSLELHRPPRPLYGTWSIEPPPSGKVEPPSDETLTALRRRGYLTDLTAGKKNNC